MYNVKSVCCCLALVLISKDLSINLAVIVNPVFRKDGRAIFFVTFGSQIVYLSILSTNFKLIFTKKYSLYCSDILIDTIHTHGYLPNSIQVIPKDQTSTFPSYWPSSIARITSGAILAEVEEKDKVKNETEKT